MDKIKWKGIFQSKDMMFFTQIDSTKVSVSDGFKCVREYSYDSFIYLWDCLLIYSNNASFFIKIIIHTSEIIYG